MKSIVTHFAPDVDAITSVWLIKRFLPEWGGVKVAFVPAGKTLDDEIVDSNPDVLHVDTGMGKLDHHQTSEDTCAAKRTLEYIEKERSKNNTLSKNFPDEALIRLVDVVNDIDHFREMYYPNPTADFYEFSLVSIIDGLKLRYYDQAEKIIELGLVTMDGIYKSLQNKVWAEKELKAQAVEFKTKWGKAVAIETINDEVLRLAQKKGYIVVVRKDPKKDYVRIKAAPNSKVDFTTCYNKYRLLDKKATWFLHAGKKMILNGSMKNPETKPTSLTLREIIDVLKKSK